MWQPMAVLLIRKKPLMSLSTPQQTGQVKRTELLISKLPLSLQSGATDKEWWSQPVSALRRSAIEAKFPFM